MPQMSPMVWLIFPIIMVMLSVVMMVINEGDGVYVGVSNLGEVNKVKVKW